MDKKIVILALTIVFLLTSALWSLNTVLAQLPPPPLPPLPPLFPTSPGNASGSQSIPGTDGSVPGQPPIRTISSFEDMHDEVTYQKMPSLRLRLSEPRRPRGTFIKPEDLVMPEIIQEITPVQFFESLIHSKPDRKLINEESNE